MYVIFFLSECFFRHLAPRVWITKVLLYEECMYICMYVHISTYMHAIHMYIYPQTKLSYSSSVFDIYTIFLRLLVWHSSAPYPTDCSCATEHIQWTTLKIIIVLIVKLPLSQGNIPLITIQTPDIFYHSSQTFYNITHTCTVIIYYNCYEYIMMSWVSHIKDSLLKDT